MKEINTLLDMLSYKRRHDSDTEKLFCEMFIKPHKYTNINGAAYMIEVGSSDTMFSCHVDTVHRTGGKQSPVFDEKTNTILKTDGEPLGADDGAGVWLLLEMIDNKVPGTYVFHRGEEVGGIGSRFISKHHIPFLKKFKRAIAFDRRGDTDVITHQSMRRTCSDTFASALATEINSANNGRYKPCSGGIFTDTANYVNVIPNCTNVSCGYDNEHTGSEILDVNTLLNLRKACLKIKWDSLPA